MEFHSEPVNVVRFSPDGLSLASAGDGKEVIQEHFNAPMYGLRRINALHVSRMLMVLVLHTFACSDRWIAIWQRAGTTALTGASSTDTPMAVTDSTTTNTNGTSTAPATPGSDVAAGSAPNAPMDLTDDTAATPTPSSAPTTTPIVTAPSIAFGTDPNDIIESKETWLKVTGLMGHFSAVYDLTWSPSSTGLASASIDNSSIIWDVTNLAATSDSVRTLYRDHGGYVQGVSWDPLDEYIITQSADRSIKLYQRISKKKAKKNDNEFNLVATVRSRKIQTPAGTKENEEKQVANEDEVIVVEDIPSSPTSSTAVPSSPSTNPNTTAPKPATRSALLFMDETLPSFFRRLAWSNDGLLLVCPAGQFDEEKEEKKESNNATAKVHPTVHIFHRYNLLAPIVHLPCRDPAIAIRFCPTIYKKRVVDEKEAWFDKPYRMVFAVATLKW